MKLIIHAPNVHRGGGRVLLLSLLEALGEEHDYLAIVDSRLQLPAWVAKECIDSRVPPTLLGRLRADRRLKSLADDVDTAVLCFGNLPPLFKISGRVFLYLQNRYLTGGLDPSGFAWRTRIRVRLERLWLRSRMRNVSEIIVQSVSMAEETEQNLGVKSTVLTFVPNEVASKEQEAAVKSRRQCRFEFIYVASGEPHKNHKTLLKAWSLLANDNLNPSLCITVDPDLYPEIADWISETISSEKLNVKNVGEVRTSSMNDLYNDASALIYPSFGESLGLPLLEARGRDMPIIAAETDFVRDMVEPQETFDPGSAVSIARAVKRYLALPTEEPTILDSRQFLEILLSR